MLMPTLLERETPPMLPASRERIRYAEFRQMDFDDDDNFYYELLDGELVAKSAPSPFHQRVSRNIVIAMHEFVTTHSLGEVLYAPVDVFLDEYNAPQPDVLFISTAKAHIVTVDGVQDVPDLVVEILSPSSVKRDRGLKMKLYERHGVAEYWLVDVRARSVEVYANAGNDFELHEVYVAEREREPERSVAVRSLVLPEFAMPIDAVFAGVDERTQ
jgi:Uma2 family endonuclease